MENKVIIEGVVKWAPDIYEARTAEQSDVASLKLEHTHPKSEKTSVFTVKQFDNGEDGLVAAVKAGLVDQGTQLKVEGYLREGRWKDKKTDEWKSQVEINAFSHEVIGSDGAAVPVAAAVDDSDEIPF